MDIEYKLTESKSRKGSCSTIPSPNQTFDSLEADCFVHIPKHKKVKKQKKLRRYSSLMEGKSNSFIEDENKILMRENKNRIFLMVREIYELFHLHIDTYLVCLKIVNSLNFDGEPFLCFQVAGSICLLVSKLYESDKISFNHIYAWCGENLTKENFIETEAVILGGMNFNLPEINPVWSESEIEEEVNRIEAIYL